MNSFMQPFYSVLEVASYSMRELFSSGCAGKRISGVSYVMALPLSVQVWSRKSNAVGYVDLKREKMTQKDRHKWELLRDGMGGKGINQRQKNARGHEKSILRDKGKSSYICYWNFSLLFGTFISGTIIKTLVLKFCLFIW